MSRGGGGGGGRGVCRKGEVRVTIFHCKRMEHNLHFSEKQILFHDIVRLISFLDLKITFRQAFAKAPFLTIQQVFSHE